MKMLRKVKELLGVGDTVSVNITREEYEAYAKKQEEAKRKAMKELEKEIGIPDTEEEKKKFIEMIRQSALEAGPSLARRFWWKISDLLSFLPGVFSFIDRGLFNVCWGLAYVWWITYLLWSLGSMLTTGLFFNFFFVLAPLLAVSLIICDKLSHNYTVIKDSPSTMGGAGFFGGMIQLAMFLFFFNFTFRTALAPTDGFVGVLKDKNGVLSVYDYGKIWWIDCPYEHTKMVVKYYNKPTWYLNRASAETYHKISEKKFRIDANVIFVAPDVSKFLELYKSEGSIEQEVKIASDILDNLLKESLSGIEEVLSPKIKILEEAKSVMADISRTSFEGAQEILIADEIRKRLSPRLGGIRGVVISPAPDGLEVRANIVDNQ